MEDVFLDCCDRLLVQTKAGGAEKLEMGRNAILLDDQADNHAGLVVQADGGWCDLGRRGTQKRRLDDRLLTTLVDGLVERLLSLRRMEREIVARREEVVT